METNEYLFNEGTRSDSLLVLLPGLGDTDKKFSKEGIIDLLGNTTAETDVVTVNAHYKYYESRTLIDRLLEDVIYPARRQGYRNIRVAGVSLGGFGALLLLKYRPEEVDAVGLIAPYLGEKEYYEYLLHENAQEPEIEYKQNLWPWLTRLDSESTNRIYIGYGEEDEFAVPGALLSERLPEGNGIAIKGGHNWSTFGRIFQQLIAESRFLETQKPDESLAKGW